MFRATQVCFAPFKPYQVELNITRSQPKVTSIEQASEKYLIKSAARYG